MSKSLKNFITIDVSNTFGWTRDIVYNTYLQEILQKYSARQLRLAFLMTLWNAKIDFSDSLMTGEIRNIETTLNVSTALSQPELTPCCLIGEIDVFHIRRISSQLSKRLSTRHKLTGPLKTHGIVSGTLSVG